MLRAKLLGRYADVRFNDAGASLAGAALIEFLIDRERAITGLERFDDGILAQLPRLEVISRFGVGVDMLDLAALDRRGVRVAVTSGSNAQSVAELALTLALAVLRGLTQRTSEVQAGTWRQLPGRLLAGQTVGILGYGHAGRRFATLVAAFGCPVLVFDEQRIDDLPVQIRQVDLDDLMADSDVVSLHLPLTPATTGLVDELQLGRMRAGSVLVNTARGELVDEQALAAALRSGHLAGAGLDVLTEEPPSREHPLLRLPNVVVTPHVGGSTIEAVLETGIAAIEGLEA